MDIDLDLEAGGRSRPSSIFIPESAATSFLDPNFCAYLQWRNINYKVKDKVILENVTGEAFPGEVKIFS
jgi:hypothetical protein